MKTHLYRNSLAMIAIGLFSNPSYASTNYLSEAHLSLEIIGFTDSNGDQFDVFSLPSSISVSSFDNSNDINYSTSSTGDSFADAVATPFADPGLIDLDVQASGYAGYAYSFAQSDATASGGFEFSNTSSTLTYTVDMLLSYAFSGIVGTDTPADQQNGIASIDIDLFGDFNLPEILSISAMTELGQSPFSDGEDDLAVSFLLGTNESENVFASLFSYGESESIAARSVPEPAPIFLFSSALIGFFVRKKVNTIDQ